MKKSAPAWILERTHMLTEMYMSEQFDKEGGLLPLHKTYYHHAKVII